MAYGARSACIPALEPYPWIILLPWLVRVDTGPTVLKPTGFEAASFLPVSCEAGVAPTNCSGTTCVGAVCLDEIASLPLSAGAGAAASAFLRDYQVWACIAGRGRCLRCFGRTCSYPLFFLHHSLCLPEIRY